MPAKEFYLEQIEKELAGAREAQKSGNDGKARVCARRAAGWAITWFLSRHSKKAWGVQAMTQLTMLKEDRDFPQEVRDAAGRLTTRISGIFKYPFPTDPVEDSKLIVDYICGTTTDGAG